MKTNMILNSFKKISWISIFIFIFQIEYAKFQDCNSVNPSIILDCSKISNSTNSCCFYKNNNRYYCTWWGSKFVGTTTANGLTFHCDNPRGSQCGGGLISSLADCDRFSASTNTCCYYKLNGVSGCFWWGAYFKGTTTLNGATLECSQSYMKTSFILILLIFYLL